MRGSRWLLASVLVLLVASVAGIDAPHATADDDPDKASIWLVTKIGLTQDEAGRLAEAFDVPLALDEGGAFHFVSPSYGDVPTSRGWTAAVAVGAGDEGERETTAEAPDFEALRRLAPVGDDDAARRRPPPSPAQASLLPNRSMSSHSELDVPGPG